MLIAELGLLLCLSLILGLSFLSFLRASSALHTRVSKRRVLVHCGRCSFGEDLILSVLILDCSQYASVTFAKDFEV